MNASLNDLLAIIGEKEVTILLLKNEIADLKRAAEAGKKEG